MINFVQEEELSEAKRMHIKSLEAVQEKMSSSLIEVFKAINASTKRIKKFYCTYSIF
jgi:hypothetical protein